MNNSEGGLGMTKFWKLFYKISENIFIIKLVSFLFKIVSKVIDKNMTEKVLRVFSKIFSTPGRYKVLGYIHPHADLFYWTVHRQVWGLQQLPKRNPEKELERPLRIGMYGQFVGLVCFQKEMFEGFPIDKDLFVYDIQTSLGYRAEWINHTHAHYRPVLIEKLIDSNIKLKGWINTDYSPIIPDKATSYYDELHRVADLINKDKLDIFINARYGASDSFDLIDLIDTPCIINACTGSAVMNHSKLDFDIFVQPQADFFSMQNHMYCSWSHTIFKNKLVFDGPAFYSSRGIDSYNVASWEERENIIIFHGSLYKLSSKPVIECIFKLLQEDDTLEFVFMGRDDGQLQNIMNMAKSKGVIDRVNYKGNLLPTIDVNGKVIGEGWEEICSWLKKARLGINPWPVGGGAALFEDYSAGVPSIVMGVKYEASNLGKKQDALVEVTCLKVPQGTAYSLNEYETLCRKCLYDKEYADNLVGKQLDIARSLSDAGLYWEAIISLYKNWLAYVYN